MFTTSKVESMRGRTKSIQTCPNTKGASVNTVALARCIALCGEMEAVSTAFLDSGRKPLKRFSSHRRVSHRPEATVLMLLLYRGSELFGTWHSMLLIHYFAL